jgi:hypothetical protein
LLHVTREENSESKEEKNTLQKIVLEIKRQGKKCEARETKRREHRNNGCRDIYVGTAWTTREPGVASRVGARYVSLHSTQTGCGAHRA